MTPESALTFFIAILIFGITPGPGVFAILARALTRGTGSCFLLALGMTLSDILYLVAACYGLAAIAQHWGEAFTLIRVLGAIYLTYLGWKMWTAPLTLDTQTDSRQTDKTLSFVQGFLISASNPKVILFYIAFLPTFMDLDRLSNADIALASALTLAALMLGLMLIAHFATKARRWLRSEIAVRRLNRTAGSLMVAAAAYLVTR
ncbi:MAG: threonine/homoserine/homoserine lactone efflux protein [Motiliproteus sp.]|jgi:threonine/homoserine/homoserine lactone efflux protein